MANYVRVIFVNNGKVDRFATRYLFGDPHAQCSVGSIIKDNRYDNPMFVVECLKTTQVIATINGGIPVKNLQISSIATPSRRFIQSLGADFDIDDTYIRSVLHAERIPQQVIIEKQQVNNLTISLEEAKQWYRSGNYTLRNLALKVFPKDTLEDLTYEKIVENLKNEGLPMVCPTRDIPLGANPENTLHSKLVTIARYFNKENWFKKPDEKGYFINLGTTSEGYKASVQNHCTITQPGVVYFKNAEDAAKAMSMVSDDLKIYM